MMAYKDSLRYEVLRTMVASNNKRYLLGFPSELLLMGLIQTQFNFFKDFAFRLNILFRLMFAQYENIISLFKTLSGFNIHYLNTCRDQYRFLIV
jgi:hypothetical protein